MQRQRCRDPHDPLDESIQHYFRAEFNRRLKPEFHSGKITSDVGLLLYREPDDILDLTDLDPTSELGQKETLRLAPSMSASGVKRTKITRWLNVRF